MINKIIVFGTLRQYNKQSYMYYLGAKYLKTIKINGIQIYNFANAYPVNKLEFTTKPLVAELWQLKNPKNDLKVLDEYEGVPFLYKRKLIKVGQNRAWFYLYNREITDEVKIESNDWLDKPIIPLYDEYDDFDEDDEDDEEDFEDFYKTWLTKNAKLL